jgi:threonyl-tRNA synthetase
LPANEPFTPEDLPVIEKKMREIIARNKPFTKEVWSRDKAKRVFADKGEAYKVELIDAIPGRPGSQDLQAGRLVRPVPRPAHGVDRADRFAFKLMKVAGAYWRGDSNNTMLTRIYGTAWADQAELEAYLHMLEEAEKRDHRKARPRDGPVPFPGRGAGRRVLALQGLADVPEPARYMRRRLENDL